ncbi:MAG: hypothetical protein FWG05_01750, partial [Kiritimatiellaeota bacterium]|nr:hypothetical protein [Kiritimatiellota bacterium]
MTTIQILKLSALLVAGCALCHGARAEETKTAEPPKATTAKLGVEKKKVGDTNVSPISGKTYTLKWIDDFNGNSLNTNNWVYETKNLNKWQIFVKRPQNVEVKDGNLHLIVRKEDKQYTGDIES